MMGPPLCKCEGTCAGQVYLNDLEPMKEIVRALDAAGFAIVPKEATGAMILAPRTDNWVAAALMVEAGRVKP